MLRERRYSGNYGSPVGKNPHRHCDSSNIELSQGTKHTEQTPGSITVSPVVETEKPKHLMTHVTNQLLYLIP